MFSLQFLQSKKGCYVTNLDLIIFMRFSDVFCSRRKHIFFLVKIRKKGVVLPVNLDEVKTSCFSFHLLQVKSFSLDIFITWYFIFSSMDEHVLLG